MTLIVFRHVSDRLFRKLVLQSYFREIWTKCFILGRPEIGFRVRKVLDLGFREDVSILLETFLKGVFSKPSGNHIVSPNLCFLSQRPQILAACLFFHFAELCKFSARLDNIDIRHFIRVPPLIFFDFLIYQKFKGGTLIKCLISMLSNLAENLHSSAK